MTTSDMANLISQLKALKENGPQDKLLRKELYGVIRDLSFSMEDPQDSINRIAYSVLILNHSSQAA